MFQHAPVLKSQNHKHTSKSLARGMPNDENIEELGQHNFNIATMLPDYVNKMQRHYYGYKSGNFSPAYF